MSIEDASDRLDIVRTLGGIERECVTVRHPGGQFDATFDNGFSDADFGEHSIESAQPMLSVVRTLDVASLAKDTPLTVIHEDGSVVEYKLEKHEPDGTGMSRVILSL